MAVDEALLESVTQAMSIPVLRLYAWSPPCLSIGYAQSIADIDQPRLAAQGWQVVRRPTGGRAILHTDELTYAVIAPQDEPRLAGGVLASYRRLSTALLRALHLLEAPAESTQPTGKAARNQEPVCFEVPSSYEITVDGKKLIGSAQVRKRGGVLQHGTLPLSGDLARITRALAYAADNDRQAAAQRVLKRAATLEAALGRVVPWDDAADALATAFASELSLELVPSALTREETTRAQELEVQKYAHPSWTNKVFVGPSRAG
jgi:lipoate-protein ligase A